MDKAEQLLDYISPRMKFAGKQALLLALQIAVEWGSQRPFSSLKCTKDVYPVVAEKMHCSLSSSEKAIYRALSICWMNGKNEHLNQIIGRHFSNKPSPSELLLYCAYYLITGKAYHGAMLCLGTEKKE